MGVMTKFYEEKNKKYSESSEQSASWCIVEHNVHGKCLLIRGYSSQNAKSQGKGAAQHMLFPESCIEKFHDILEKWKSEREKNDR